jgi:acetolactate synthase-1/2/3 large subunit
MPAVYDGGEAVLEAFRRLEVDYIISSPGSEWPPVWEALARQRVHGRRGPTYINCWHESLAVAMALGYTAATDRLVAVLLHAGVGLLQGALALHAAQQGEIPMLVCSGEAITYGEDPQFDPGWQWLRNLSVVGGPARLVEPVVKWATHIASHHILYESVIRAGELARRSPRGPTYLTIPLEVMLQPWTPRPRKGPAPMPPKVHPEAAAVARVAELLAGARSPVMLTEACGRSPEAFRCLVELAELLAMPVVESGAPLYANFPKDHPLHLGFDAGRFRGEADVWVVVAHKAPWYPPRASPPEGATVVVIDEHPLKGHMVYQSLQADLYLEGDVATTLRLLVDMLRCRADLDAQAIRERRARWEAEHRRLQEGYRTAAAAAQDRRPIDAVWLCTALSQALPDDAIYVEETIVHRPAILRHVAWNQAQRYFHPPGGLGVGLGMALGIALARPRQPVVALMGDGSFLYNPIVPSLGAACEHKLPIMIVLFDNGSYASMKRSHLAFYPQGAAASAGLFHGVDIPGPDYARLADAFGGYGVRVEDQSDLKAALQGALAAVERGQLALVDVAVAR